MKSTLCDKCNNNIRNSNYKKHYNVCKGTLYKPSLHCVHCKKVWSVIVPENLSNYKISSFKRNHIRWCNENPNVEFDKNKTISNLTYYNSKIENKILKSEKIKELYSQGVYDDAMKKRKINPPFKGKLHSIESKKLIQKKALQSNHRRLRRKIIHYNGVMLDSSWEYLLAVRLDELNIKWVRPKSLKWVDNNNIQHNYFPDFYLIEYDIYLDPKNTFAYDVQKEKIKILNTTYSNIFWIINEEICKSFEIKMIKFANEYNILK